MALNNISFLQNVCLCVFFLNSVENCNLEAVATNFNQCFVKVGLDLAKAISDSDSQPYVEDITSVDWWSSHDTIY